jgi:O-antigen ligase
LSSTNLRHTLRSPETRINGLLAAVIFAMPFGFDPATSLLLLFILIHTIIFVKGSDWLAALKNPVYLVSGLFFLYYASTLFWADNQADGLRQLETKLSFLVSPLVVLANAKWLGKAHINYQKKALVWGSIATMIVAFVYAGMRTLDAGQTYFLTESGKQVSFFTYTELSSPFMHVGYLSTFVGVAVLLHIDELVVTQKHRLVKVGILLALLFYMFMLQGRMNVLALLLVAGIAVIYYIVKYRAFKWLLLPVLPILILVVAVPILPDALVERYFQIPDFEYDISADASQFNSATYRLAEWKGATALIVENPVFGTGVGDNRQALVDKYEELGFYVGVDRKYNAHNQYLETTLASGFVGLLFLLFFIGFWMKRSLQNKDVAIFFAMLFFAFCMLTESMFERAWAVIFFAVFFSVMLSAGRGQQKTVHKKS